MFFSRYVLLQNFLKFWNTEQDCVERLDMCGAHGCGRNASANVTQISSEDVPPQKGREASFVWLVEKIRKDDVHNRGMADWCLRLQRIGTWLKGPNILRRGITMTRRCNIANLYITFSLSSHLSTPLPRMICGTPMHRGGHCSNPGQYNKPRDEPSARTHRMLELGDMAAKGSHITILGRQATAATRGTLVRHTSLSSAIRLNHPLS